MNEIHYERPIPCRAFTGDKEDHAKFEVMRHKRAEEENELREAITAYEKLETKNRLKVGKAREHILEEGVDLIVAIYTTLCIVATEDDINEEIRKVNIKNKLRGYHESMSDEEIPF